MIFRAYILLILVGFSLAIVAGAPRESFWFFVWLSAAGLGGALADAYHDRRQRRSARR